MSWQDHATVDVSARGCQINQVKLTRVFSGRDHVPRMRMQCARASANAALSRARC